jgi:hypothetical protein
LTESDGLWGKYILKKEFEEHYDFAYNLMNMMIAFKEKIK